MSRGKKTQQAENFDQQDPQKHGKDQARHKGSHRTRGRKLKVFMKQPKQQGHHRKVHCALDYDRTGHFRHRLAEKGYGPDTSCHHRPVSYLPGERIFRGPAQKVIQDKGDGDIGKHLLSRHSPDAAGALQAVERIPQKELARQREKGREQIQEKAGFVFFIIILC